MSSPNPPIASDLAARALAGATASLTRALGEVVDAAQLLDHSPLMRAAGARLGPILRAVPVDGGVERVYRCRGARHAVAVYDTNEAGDLIPVEFRVINDVVQLVRAPVGEVRIQVPASVYVPPRTS